MGLFDSLKSKISKTRENFAGRLNSLASNFKKVDEDLFEELEEILVLADVGYEMTETILDKLRSYVKENDITNPEDIKSALQKVLAELMDAPALNLKMPCAIFVVGVNGVGKTTTIAKLADYYIGQGKSIMLAAADTFRAAAAEQLATWGDRVGVRVIKYAEGADPAAVVYDAIDAAKHAGTDILLIDTAGRLHNKKNLMAELDKMRRVISAEYDESSIETFLIIDATTGQNAVLQAKAFAEVTNVTGVVLTKMDGTAKGGIACAVRDVVGVPVRFIGVGEKEKDIMPFDADEFSKALVN